VIFSASRAREQANQASKDADELHRAAPPQGKSRHSLDPVRKNG